MEKRLLYLLLLFSLCLTASAQSNFEKVVEACSCAVSAFKDGGNRAEMEKAISLMDGAAYDKLYIEPVDTVDAIALDDRLIFSRQYFSDYLSNTRRMAREYETGERGLGDMPVYITTIGLKPKGKVTYRRICDGRSTVDIHCLAEVGRKINVVIKYRPWGSDQPYKIVKDNHSESAGLEQRKLYGITFDTTGQQEMIIEVRNTTAKPTSVACIANIYRNRK